MQEQSEELLQKIYLLEAIARSKSGLTDNIEQLISKIKPEHFDPFSKKYLLLLYLKLTIEQRRREDGYKVQLDSLLEETGFKRLNNTQSTSMRINDVQV